MTAPATEAPVLSRDPWAHAPTLSAEVDTRTTLPVFADAPLAHQAGGRWVPVTCATRNAVAAAVTLEITASRTVPGESVFTEWSALGSPVLADMTTPDRCWHLTWVRDPKPSTR